MCSCNKGRQLNVQQMISTVGSSLPYLKFAYCAYKSQFERVFSDVGINVNESLLPKIAALYDSGDDMKGVVIGKDSKPIVFSVAKQLALIDVSKSENSSCTI